MKDSLNKILDDVSEYLAHRKGLVPMVGVGFVIINFLVKLVLPGSWFAGVDLLLHVGVITAILGFLLAWAL